MPKTRFPGGVSLNMRRRIEGDIAVLHIACNFRGWVKKGEKMIIRI